jgi:hypothetical protein
MSMRSRPLLIVAVCFIAAALFTVAARPAAAQDSVKVASVAAATAHPPQDSSKIRSPSAFFASEQPLEVTLTTNIGKIRGDRRADPPWRPATLSYKSDSGSAVTVPVEARTRGIWRLKMCDFPPLRLNFKGETTRGTIFHKLDKPKLVSYCQDNDLYEQYILQEYQLYRIYGLLTPVSHRVRLFKFNYADSGSGKIRAKRYGFIMEEPNALGARLGGRVLEQKGALPADLDPFQDALFGVFQYFIGNTDFSVGALHNVELFFATQGTISPVPYDFDFSGVINARYAIPDPSLNIPNVRQRLFRGYCTDPAEYEKVFALFNEKKPAIYALYSDSIGKLIDHGTVKSTLRYFDDFYKTINDRHAAKDAIIEPCIGRGH